jgi:hypothetical protein
MKTFFTLVVFTVLTTTVMTKEITTEIIIHASPEKVWAILTDFKAYPNWNPFIKSVDGDVHVGNKIKVRLDGMVFKPKVLAFETNKEIRWIGRLLFPGLFDGEHTFLLIDNGDGTTSFIQRETFNGILVPLFHKKLDTDTKAGFEAMNKKLKVEAEK